RHAFEDAPRYGGLGMAVRWLHSGLYHGAQLLRGRPIAPLMRRLRQWDRLDAAGYRELADRRLAAMLEYAHRTVPLYRTAQWRSVQKGAGADLRDWPVLERRSL